MSGDDKLTAAGKDLCLKFSSIVAFNFYLWLLNDLKQIQYKNHFESFNQDE